MASDIAAVRAVEEAGLPYRLVRTAIPSSAEESAALQGIELSRLLRTIVVRRGDSDYVFVLVPGGRHIDWPKLRAALGVRRLSLPDRDEAKDVTGYERGAITPFGSAGDWPVVADSSIVDAGVVAIGAGERGANFHVDSAGLLEALQAVIADVTGPD